MQAIESLALFPLSDVVLLPEVSVPLFIFEPRYRQMARDSMAGSRQIGMIAVRPDCVAEMQGDPRTFDVGCVGRVAQAQERPDGTFQLLLVGEQRFRIREEHPRAAERLYRSARVDLLDDSRPTTKEEFAKLAACRIDVLETLERLVTRARVDGSGEESFAELSTLEPARLINALVQSVSFDPIERQQLLEADSILTRFEFMADLLRFRIAQNASTGRESRSLLN